MSANSDPSPAPVHQRVGRVEIRTDDAGIIDEIVARNVDVHWEYLTDHSAMLRVGDVHLTVWTTRCRLRLCGHSEDPSVYWEGGEFSRPPNASDQRPATEPQS